jgi:hypothetical protein
MNRKLPEYLLGKYQLMGTVTFSVLFAVVFLNMSIPFSDTAWFGLGDSVMFLYTLLFGALAIIALIASRMTMYKVKNLFEMTYVEYILWCVGEIVVIAGLYTWITTDVASPQTELPLKVFGRALNNGIIALGVPYLIAAMYFAIIDKNNTIRLMNYENVVTDEPPKPEARQKITLFDNNGSLKMSVSPESLYYIESDDNYIKIWYTDNKGTLQPYILRCRLKTVEASFKGSGLIRCNRKYIVNMNKVVTLRKENDGYILILDNVDIPPIPVTKTYNDAVLNHFTETSPLLEPMDEE